MGKKVVEIIVKYFPYCRKQKYCHRCKLEKLCFTLMGRRHLIGKERK